MGFGAAIKRLSRGSDGRLLYDVDGNDLDVLLASAEGTVYYVDANEGDDDNNDGLSWDKAFKTMDRAFYKLDDTAQVASGDTIVARGTTTENLATPPQVFDVTIIGAGNRPRHADSTPEGGEVAPFTWKAATGSPNLQIRQQGWRVINVLFVGATDDSAVSLLRNSDSGDDERDASHAEIIGCRFASGQDGVENDGGAYNVKIAECSFHDLTGHAFKQGGASVANPFRWEIIGNRVQNCANLFGAWNFRETIIKGNVFVATTTALIDTSGGNGDNVIIDNVFDIDGADFDPAGGVTGKSGEVWSNILADSIETGLPTN